MDENPFTPEEVERYDVEFSRLNGAVRQANKELQSFTGWLAGRPGRH